MRRAQCNPHQRLLFGQVRGDAGSVRGGDDGKQRWSDAMPSNGILVTRTVRWKRVSWADAQIFLTRLNAQQSANIPAGWAYVLPTESQWEYACRAGTTTAYSWGDDDYASNANYTMKVTDSNKPAMWVIMRPTHWGFFDMHGNVFEWTADWYQVGLPDRQPGGGSHRTGIGLDSGQRGAWFWSNPGSRMELPAFSSPSNSIAGIHQRIEPHNVTLTQGECRLPCWFPTVFRCS